MQHWPCRLVDERTEEINALPRIEIEGPVRGAAVVKPASVDDSQKLVILRCLSRISRTPWLIILVQRQKHPRPEVKKIGRMSQNCLRYSWALA